MHHTVNRKLTITVLNRCNDCFLLSLFPVGLHRKEFSHIIQRYAAFTTDTASLNLINYSSSTKWLSRDTLLEQQDYCNSFRNTSS